MRKGIIFYCIALMCMYTSKAQNASNKALIGLYGYYSLPLFQLAKENYKPGAGFSIAYLSRKLTLSEDKQISLRLGPAFGISGQGYRSFTSTSDSITYRQNFQNTYYFLDFIGRFTSEKDRTFKPYGEVFIGLASFSSHETPSNYNSATDSYAEYKTNAINFGIAAGCMLRITDGFYIDGKITFTQCRKTIAFIDLDKFTYTEPYYHPFERNAVPSLITAQLGILFRIPKVSGSRGGTNRYIESDPSYHSPSNYQAPVPQKEKPHDQKTGSPSDSDPTNVPKGRPRTKH